MAKETLNVRVTKLEDLTAVLLASQMKTEQRFRELAASIAQTDAQLRELGQQTDKRIGGLVRAIGELMHRKWPTV